MSAVRSSTRVGAATAGAEAGRRAAQPVTITRAATAIATRDTAILAKEYRRPGRTVQSLIARDLNGQTAIARVQSGIMRPLFVCAIAVAIAVPTLRGQSPGDDVGVVFTELSIKASQTLETRFAASDSARRYVIRSGTALALIRGTYATATT